MTTFVTVDNTKLCVTKI